MAETPAQFEHRFVPRLLASIGKARQRGLSWLIERAKHEVQVPTSAPGRLLRNALASIERGALRSIACAARAHCRMPGRPRTDTLYFFIDLEVAPITFDAVSGLAIAELFRRRHGLENIHVVVVPGTIDGLKEEAADYAAVVGPEARRWRIHNLLIPLCRLLPSCTGYTICGSRREAHVNWFAAADHVFPEGYSVAFPRVVEKRDASDAARAGEAVLPMFRAGPAGARLHAALSRAARRRSARRRDQPAALCLYARPQQQRRQLDRLRARIGQEPLAAGVRARHRRRARPQAAGARGIRGLRRRCRSISSSGWRSTSSPTSRWR